MTILEIWHCLDISENTFAITVYHAVTIWCYGLYMFEDLFGENMYEANGAGLAMMQPSLASFRDQCYLKMSQEYKRRRAHMSQNIKNALFIINREQ